MNGEQFLDRANKLLRKALMDYMASMDVDGEDPLRASYAWFSALQLMGIDLVGRMMTTVTSDTMEDAMTRMGVSQEDFEQASKEFEEAKWLWRREQSPDGPLPQS